MMLWKAFMDFQCFETSEWVVSEESTFTLRWIRMRRWVTDADMWVAREIVFQAEGTGNAGGPREKRSRPI